MGHGEGERLATKQAAKAPAKKAVVKAPSKAVAKKAPAKRAPGKAAVKVKAPQGPVIPDWRVPTFPPRIYETALVQPDISRTDCTVGEAIPLMMLQGDRFLQAAQRLCVFPATAKGWVTRGVAEVAASVAEERDTLDSEAPYVWLAMGVMRAEAEWEHWAVQLWQAKFGSDWHAVYALLKERNPDAYGNSQRMEVTGSGGGPVQVQVPSVADVMSSLAQVESQWRDQQRQQLPPVEGTATDG